MDIRQLIRCARGDEPADLVVTNAKIVNVFTGDIVSGNIAIKNGTICGVGDYHGQNSIDMNGRFVAPGFIDAHVHIESSMLSVAEFANTVVQSGTTTVMADPHEIANVMGKKGLDYMLCSAEGQPMDIFFTLPSCVPATHLETSGSQLTAGDLSSFLTHERVVGLAEMMNFPGVIHEDQSVLEKIQMAKTSGKIIDGHSPGLSGRDLNAYIAAGIGSDHECVTAKEAGEKLAAGMAVMVREGTGAKNLKDLLPAINYQTHHRMMWCTDDRHPHDLMEKGHIDDMVRQAIGLGLDPVMAIQMATLHPANYFRMGDTGAIAPGRKANLVVFSDLNEPVIDQVYVKGMKVVEKGRLLTDATKPDALPAANTINLDGDHLNFDIPALSNRIHLIEVVVNQIVTKHRVVDISVRGNLAMSDTSRDILKCAVVERHRNTGQMGKGFVKGFGLKTGALASSVAHDSHNIIVVGTNDGDMKGAVKKVIDMKGGMAACSGGRIQASLALPIAGLMSNHSIDEVCRELDKLVKVSRDFGTHLGDPFMTLSFLALPVIPEIKITDLGLVDVTTFNMLPLFI